MVRLSYYRESFSFKYTPVTQRKLEPSLSQVQPLAPRSIAP